MNLAESTLIALKTKSHLIIKDIWVDEMKNPILLKFESILKIIKSNPLSLKNIKLTFSSIRETFEAISILPKRVRVGLVYFVHDFKEELNTRQTSTEKSKYCLMVLSNLIALTEDRKIFLIKGVNKGKVIFWPIILELMVKTVRLFVFKLIQEIEKDITSEEEIKNLIKIKSRLDNKKYFEAKPVDDQSLNIVNKLRYYILTGMRQ